jgi:hypothetical protein
MINGPHVVSQAVFRKQQRAQRSKGSDKELKHESRDLTRRSMCIGSVFSGELEQTLNCILQLIQMHFYW